MSDELLLLDTNVVLALVRGSALGKKLDAKFQLRARPERPLICRVTHGEMRVLAERNGWGDKKRASLQLTLDNLVTVEIHHEAVVDAYVEIDVASQNHSTGSRNMGKNDLWIAACAKAAGATLVTADADFDHLDQTLVNVVRVSV